MPKFTVPQIIAGVILLVIVIATICFLPSTPAWNLLTQIAVGLVKTLSGVP